MILPKEKQCVSLDTAQRMKELEFRQDTEYAWIQCTRGKGSWELMLREATCTLPSTWDYDNMIATPTTSELGVILPGFLCTKSLGIMMMYIEKLDSMWKISYEKHHIKDKGSHYEHDINIRANTLAESMGLMYCYLKEAGLL